MKRMIAGALALCLLCTGCGLLAFSGVFSDLPPGFSGSYAGIYRSGDGGSGVYEDDEKIASREDNLYAEKLMADNQSDSQKSKVVISFSKFHGKQQYFKVNATEDEAHTFSYKMKTGKGRVKLVLVLPDGSVSPLAEIDDTEKADDTAEVTLPEGKTKVVLACDNAEDGEVLLSLDKPGCLDQGGEEPEPVPDEEGAVDLHAVPGGIR